MSMQTKIIKLKRGYILHIIESSSAISIDIDISMSSSLETQYTMAAMAMAYKQQIDDCINTIQELTYKVGRLEACIASLGVCKHIRIQHEVPPKYRSSELNPRHFDYCITCHKLYRGAGAIKCNCGFK